MISIRCSMLEAIRKNPLAYGQLLAIGDNNSSGGSHGMFAYFQDVARLVHLGEISATDGVKELYNKFHRFNSTSQNKSRQEKLVEQFIKYCKLFDQQGLVFLGGSKLIKWDFTNESRLTGRTPWLIANEDAYYSYILTEKDFAWQNELRFPLFQHYIADRIIECRIEEIKVGVYSLPKNQFEFKSFSEKEIEGAISEMEDIFVKVQTEYNKLKTK